MVFSFVTLIPGVRSLIRWENRRIGGSFFTSGFMVILTAIGIIVYKMDFEETGIRVNQWKKSLNMGFKGFLSFLVPQLVLTILWGWGLNYGEYSAVAVILGGVILGVTLLLIGNLGKNRTEISRSRLALILIILVIPFSLGLVFGQLSIKLFTFFSWQVLAGGFIEELFFRGLIQSMVNNEYGTHWRLRGVSFGPGLFVSSILYGLSRAMRQMNPLRGIYGLNFGWGFYVFTLGIFYGFIREASGDIIGSGSANALIDGFGATLFKVLF